jgi:TolB-like protein/Tfp pilus assembly protein PilF
LRESASIDLVSNVRFLFANYTLDTDRHELLCGGEANAVEPRVIDLLIYLIKNRDRVVSKDELVASVWDGRIVSDATITSHTYAARKAIGDTGQDQKLIRTIARKGLRFVGEVQTESSSKKQAPTAYSPDQINRSQPTLSVRDHPAIAVLPFTNMSSDSEQEYFSDGISEDIIAALSKLRWFFVIARSSSFIYKGKAVQMKQVAEELGVDYVVEGSVRKVGERVRITAQLNDVSTGSHIWAERYDRSPSDVFAVQDEITEAIVASIEPQLYAAENLRARRKAPGSMDAWELVMRALSHFWCVTRQDNEISQVLLEKAIVIDPNYGRALGILAASHTLGVYMGWSDMTASIPIAHRAAVSAIQADNEDPWAHYALGCADLLTRKFEDSLANLTVALHLNPSFALAQAVYGLALAYCGHWEKADLAARRALRLSPHDPFSALYYGVASYAQFLGRHYEEAIQLARTAIRLRSDYVGGHRLLTAAAAMAGQVDVAAGALQELRRTQPNVSIAWISNQMPFKRDADREHYLEAFRRAGLD